MHKIGTFEDFRHFATDKVKISPSVVDDYQRKMVFPYIVEERDAMVRTTEMNVFSKMINNRIVFLTGEVGMESMDTIVAQLLYLDSADNRDIHIYINSPGGECYSGLELVSVMDFIKSDVSTTVLGMAASMGAVIASNGTKGKRCLLPYSRFMIHQPSHHLGWTRFTDTKIAYEEMESVRNDLYEVMARNSGNSVEDVIAMCENGDKWMRPEEAIKLGFADKIITKRGE